MSGIDDPQRATRRLLVDRNLAHAMAEAYLAGRNLTATRSPISRHGTE
ncbi:hypothetical protein GGD67_002866 [Bradyrhizobium sp. IAR9]|nr:hypothetical protein [Bradyrhizobium sp. IAR9]NYG45408.1 hypothetical protein [Bradyrhizobium sp. IAR9]